MNQSRMRENVSATSHNSSLVCCNTPCSRSCLPHFLPYPTSSNSFSLMSMIKLRPKRSYILKPTLRKHSDLEDYLPVRGHYMPNAPLRWQSSRMCFLHRLVRRDRPERNSLLANRTSGITSSSATSPSGLAPVPRTVSLRLLPRRRTFSRTPSRTANTANTPDTQFTATGKAASKGVSTGRNELRLSYESPPCTPQPPCARLPLPLHPHSPVLPHFPPLLQSHMPPLLQSHMTPRRRMTRRHM